MLLQSLTSQKAPYQNFKLANLECFAVVDYSKQGYFKTSLKLQMKHLCSHCEVILTHFYTLGAPEIP